MQTMKQAAAELLAGKRVAVTGVSEAAGTRQQCGIPAAAAAGL
jgi:hypothetical protein